MTQDEYLADTNAVSYVSHSVSAVLASAEEEMKCKYLFAVEVCCASFTPFVLSVAVALGYEALMF